MISRCYTTDTTILPLATIFMDQIREMDGTDREIK